MTTILRKYKIMGLVLFTLFPSALWAQAGGIKGKVTDKKTGEFLVGTTVMIEGTTIGTVTDFDGNYVLEGVPDGTHNVRCSFISYETQIKENIQVVGGQELNIDFSLEQDIVEIGGVEVVARANRASESLLLLEQKESAMIKETIGARALSNQGVSDAAAAATKITGVIKQEGAKTLNVRGLGDRYNNTTFNGLPLPSNNAETKNIDLEIFITDIIEYIGVEKVFSSPQYGDFAGANVDIVPKKFIGNPYIQLNIKSGFNSSTLGVSPFYLQDGPGFWGMDNFGMTKTLNKYDFETKWNPQEKRVMPNLGFSLNGGKRFVFSGSKLNTFVTASFENGYSYSDLIQNRINGSDAPRKILRGEQFNYETQTTAMANLNYETEKSNIYLNSLFLNSSNQELKNLRGFIKDLAEDSALVRRAEFENTRIISNQWLGEHQLSEKSDFKWGVSYNNVYNNIPDRRHLSLNGTGFFGEGIAYFTDDNESDNFRYFHNFIENEWAANLRYALTFGQALDSQKDYRARLTAGYSGKYKLRDFESTQFNHDIYRNRSIFNPPPGGYYARVDVNDIDAFLNEENLNRADGYGFYLKTFFGNIIRPSTYNGTQMINAGFISFEYQCTEKLTALAGLRVEHVFQEVKFETSLKPNGGSGKFSELPLLPSLSLRYTMNAKSNLRFAASKTYVLPQFTEMALFLFEGITETALGNPYIYPSIIYNGELKWEFFPDRGEVLSISGFGKYIIDPINKFVMASASNDFTYANTGDWAYVYGMEAEVKKEIISVLTKSGSKKLSLSANLSLMDTRQELDGEKVRRETEDENGNAQISVNFNTEEDGLQGAAPIIGNAALTYHNDWAHGGHSVTSSLVYNYVSDRLYLIGTSSFGNQVDKSLHTVDFVLRSTFKKIGINLTAKNLLNQDIDRIQKNETRDHLVKSYKKGIKVSFGISYKF
jgi:hypothetical protein